MKKKRFMVIPFISLVFYAGYVCANTNRTLGEMKPDNIVLHCCPK